MISNRYLLVLLVLLIGCNAPENQKRIKQVSKKQLVLNPSKGLVYFQGQPFTGTSVLYNGDSLVVESCSYVKGKRDGLLKKWFDNGLKSYESKYVEGKQHGVTKSWWLNGNLRSESTFVNGRVHGSQKQWYKSGTKFKFRNIVNGKEEGLQQSWRENGKLYNNYEAKNGRIFGLKRAALCYELVDEEIQIKK